MPIIRALDGRLSDQKQMPYTKAPVKIQGVRRPHLLAVRSDRAPTNRAMKMETMEPAELMAPSTAVEFSMPRSRRRCGTRMDIVP